MCLYLDCVASIYVDGVFVLPASVQGKLLIVTC